MLYLIGIVVVLAFAGIWLYNRLISRRNATENAYASMDVMLKKRYELIPQLVDTVKGYMQHERELLTGLTELREAVVRPGLSTPQKVELDNQYTRLLETLLVRVENYPQLKAGENFLQLQRSINETEEQLAASRRFYNAAVNDYHNAIEQFPSSLVAAWSGMKRRPFFSVEEMEKAVPSTRFTA